MSSRSRDQSGNAAKRAVAELFKSGINTVNSNDLEKLRSKHGDDVASEIVELFYETKDDVKDKALGAAQYLRGKFPHKPLHLLLGAARKYKSKLKLDDFAFEEFRRIFEAELSGQSVNMSRIIQPHKHSNIMEKALGPGYKDSPNGIKVRDDEYADLQEILKIHAAMKPVHADVVIQHLQYTGTNGGNKVALAGHFDRSKDKAECHVHPVIAALFLPKVPLLEKHFLIANLAGIIKGRKNREQITNKPDYLLHKAIVNDPNDVVCDPNSAIRDLKFRCMLQHYLLNSVRSMRNGSYFDCHNREFLATIEACRLNNFDNPELLYGQDEAIVLSKLLGAFSFRPTVLSQRPIATYDPNPKSVIPKIYTRHLLQFKLRNPRVQGGANRSLNEVMVGLSYRKEQGHFIPYEEQVIYSNQVLFILVPRKLMTMDLTKMLGQGTDPINLLDLPRNLTGFERINPFEVDVPPTIVAGEDSFDLLSVVTAKISNIGTTQQTKGFIIGNAAWTKLPNGDWVCYDPREVNKPGVLRNDPRLGTVALPAAKGIVLAGAPGAVQGADQQSIFSLRPMIKYTENQMRAHAKRFGTIFMYSNPNTSLNLGSIPRHQLMINYAN